LTKYVTNFARTCFDHWSASKAVSEYVQNWLDSDGEREYSFTDTGIVLTNKNIKVSNKLLMMGKSDKRNDPSKRGRFGVGSLQSMVVLIDLGATVVIENNDVVWTPVWEYSDQYQDDIMVIIETTKRRPNNNFSVIIDGLDSETLDEIKIRCLAFQNREVLHSTKYGDLIETVNGDTGEIYVGDLYVCQNASFSYCYNFKPEFVKLCQDRNLVSQWDLQELTSKLIIATNDVELIKESITLATLDTRNCNMYWDSTQRTSPEVDNALATEFLNEHGNAFVTNDIHTFQEMTKLGNKVALVQTETLYKAITRSSVYKEAIEGVEEIVKESFADLANKVLDELEYMVQNGETLTKTYHKDLIVNLELLRERIDNEDYN
jgi:hypothetical protein